MRTVLVGTPPAELAAWLARRRALGQDRFDEIWGGEDHVVPAPHGRHGDVANQLAALLRPRAAVAGLWGSGPLNLGHTDDYRIPDGAYPRNRPDAVYLPTAAIVVEIVSPGDETRRKLDFYFNLGVHELLVVDPATGEVEWYGRGASRFERRGRSQLLDVGEADLHGEIDWPDPS